MTIFHFYLAALIATSAYVVRKGGRTGLFSVCIMVVAALGSQLLSTLSQDLPSLQPKMLTLDVVTLALQLAIAVISTRTWPMWVAAFQLNTVLAELAILISPVFHGSFYYALATIWAMPTLLVMATGTWRDQKFRGFSKWDT